MTGCAYMQIIRVKETQHNNRLSRTQTAIISTSLSSLRNSTPFFVSLFADGGVPNRLLYSLLIVTNISFKSCACTLLSPSSPSPPPPLPGRLSFLLNAILPTCQASLSSASAPARIAMALIDGNVGGSGVLLPRSLLLRLLLRLLRC